MYTALKVLWALAIILVALGHLGRHAFPQFLGLSLWVAISAAVLVFALLHRDVLFLTVALLAAPYAFWHLSRVPE
jgi:hypothetical protein